MTVVGETHIKLWATVWYNTVIRGDINRVTIDRLSSKKAIFIVFVYFLRHEKQKVETLLSIESSVEVPDLPKSGIVTAYLFAVNIVIKRVLVAVIEFCQTFEK